MLMYHVVFLVVNLCFTNIKCKEFDNKLLHQITQIMNFKLKHFCRGRKHIASIERKRNV